MVANSNSILTPNWLIRRENGGKCEEWRMNVTLRPISFTLSAQVLKVDTEYRIQNTEYRVQGTGYRAQTI